MSSLLRYSLNHPCRPPHWRWERARLIREHGKRISKRKESDHWVRAAVVLGHRLSAAHDDLDRADALEHAGPLGLAYDLWDQPSGKVSFSPRCELESRILCGQPFPDIAARLAVTPEVVTAFEAVFFNVLDRLNQPGYVLHQVIGPSIHRTMSDSDFPVLLKAYGYFSKSSELVDALSTTFTPNNISPRNRDEVLSYMSDDWRWTASRKSSLSARMLPATGRFIQEKLLEVRARMDAVEKSSGADTQQLFHQNIAVALANAPWFKPGHLPVDGTTEHRAAAHIALSLPPPTETPPGDTEVSP